MSVRWTYIDPHTVFNPFIGFQTVLIALIGGAMTLWGPLIAAIVFSVLAETLRLQVPQLYMMSLGVLLILSVLYLPGGLASLRGQTFRVGQPGTSLTVAVKLLLPDGYFGFDGVDDEAAGSEGGVAVASGDTHPDSHVAHFQAAVAVYADGGFDGKAAFGFFQNGLTLAERQLGVGAVHQIVHTLAVVLAAHPAFKAGKGAALFVVEQRLAQGGGVNGGFGEGKHISLRQSGD